MENKGEDGVKIEEKWEKVESTKKRDFSTLLRVAFNKGVFLDFLSVPL
jgi:hypothetical protein